ncbi:MAG: class I SAM-dependent methyltransferase [Acidobacteriota bacterium]
MMNQAKTNTYLSTAVPKHRKITWRHHFMNPWHDIFLRYDAIESLLKKAEVEGEILEVGSGNWGLAAWSGKSVVGVDMNFNESRVPNLVAVKADVTLLPFADASFETVISSDMLEHLSPEERPQGVKEIMRVASKFVVIAVPVGKDAERQDREIAEYQKNQGMPVDTMLVEHLENGLPNRGDVLAMIHTVDKTAEIKVIRNFNLQIRRISTKYVSSRGLPQGLLDYLITWAIRIMRPFLHIGSCYRDIYFVKRTIME